MLRCHHTIGTPISLTSNYRNLWNRGFGIGKEKFRPMFNNPTVFLLGPGQKPGDVDKSNQRNIKGIAKPDESCRLHRSVDIETAGENLRLISHNSNAAAIQACKPDDNVL